MPREPARRRTATERGDRRPGAPHRADPRSRRPSRGRHRAALPSRAHRLAPPSGEAQDATSSARCSATASSSSTSNVTRRPWRVASSSISRAISTARRDGARIATDLVLPVHMSGSGWQVPDVELKAPLGARSSFFARTPTPTLDRILGAQLPVPPSRPADLPRRPSHVTRSSRVPASASACRMCLRSLRRDARNGRDMRDRPAGLEPSRIPRSITSSAYVFGAAIAWSSVLRGPGPRSEVCVKQSAHSDRDVRTKTLEPAECDLEGRGTVRQVRRRRISRQRRRSRPAAP